VPEPHNNQGLTPPPLNKAKVARALAAVPSSTWIMTSAYEGDRAGVLVHGVLIACNQTPLVVVACRKGHAIDPVIRDSRCFALGLVDPSDRLIRRRFRFSDTADPPKADPSTDDPFDPFPDQQLFTGAPILDRCAVWMDCLIARHFDLEFEQELFVGQVVAVRVADPT
jgi:flavin reductase (DIM6/NTAB) family NADH-FMN oxidoreductase RutF